MKRVTAFVVLFVAPLLVSTARAEVNVAGWVASYLIGKAVDSVWDRVTGKPDIEKLQHRLSELERYFIEHDQQVAKQIEYLRSHVSANTSRADYERLVQQTINRIADLEARVDRNERDIILNREGIEDLRRRVAELEEESSKRTSHRTGIASSRNASIFRHSSTPPFQDPAYVRPSTTNQVIRPESPAQSRARRTFADALHLYWSRRYAEAAERFAAAEELDSTQPLYIYFLALAELQGGHRPEADAALRRAVAIESANPIAGWGTTMERVQGPPRAWIENARHAALRRQLAATVAPTN